MIQSPATTSAPRNGYKSSISVRDIIYSRHNYCFVISKKPYPMIALATQKPSYFSGFVAMVNAKPFLSILFAWWGFTYRTNSVLFFCKQFKLLNCYSVIQFKHNLPASNSSSVSVFGCPPLSAHSSIFSETIRASIVRPSCGLSNSPHAYRLYDVASRAKLFAWNRLRFLKPSYTNPNLSTMRCFHN